MKVIVVLKSNLELDIPDLALPHETPKLETLVDEALRRREETGPHEMDFEVAAIITAQKGPAVYQN